MVFENAINIVFMVMFFGKFIIVFVEQESLGIINVLCAQVHVLQQASKLKKRLPVCVKHPLVIPEYLNHTWSTGFVSDALNIGRKFRVLNVLDDFDPFLCSTRNFDVYANRTCYFRMFQEVRDITQRWREDYNKKRPHHALGKKCPMNTEKKYENKILLLI